jgi:hypothetical protein
MFVPCFLLTSPCGGFGGFIMVQLCAPAAVPLMCVVIAPFLLMGYFDVIGPGSTLS